VPFLPALPAGRSRRRRVLVIAVLVSAALLLAAFASYAFINIGRYLASEDPLSRADAILVLAGSDIERPLEAVDLYTAGYAAHIVLTRESVEPAMEALRRRGINPPFEVEWQRAVLVQLGVAQDAVIIPPRIHDNTAQEAQTLRDLAAAHGWRHVIVVSSKYHLRRAGMALRRELRETGVSVVMRGTRYDRAMPERWWSRRADIRWLLSEVPKLIAYRLGLGA
jgi:uncharacterized SAM-binding protein YcdF (DUF218 family)